MKEHEKEKPAKKPKRKKIIQSYRTVTSIFYIYSFCKEEDVRSFLLKIFWMKMYRTFSSAFLTLGKDEINILDDMGLNCDIAFIRDMGVYFVFLC